MMAQPQKAPPRPDSTRADTTRTRLSQLAPVRVSARRWRKPTVSQATASDPTGGERDGVPLGIAMNEQGSVTAMGATVAALTLLNGANGASLSAMGLPASQTSTTLNGVTFNANELPRELFAPARAVTSTFDVSQGGFAGAQLALRTYSGSVFTNGTITTRLQAPLASTPGIPASALPPFGLSGSRSGPALGGRFFYSVAANADRSDERVVTLRDAATGRVSAPALSQNVAATALRLIDSLGIPTPSDNAASHITSSSGSAFMRIDVAPTSMRSANIVAYMSRARLSPTPLAPLASTFAAGQRTTSSGALLLEHSKLLRTRFLSHTRGGITFRDATADPAFALPQARVLVLTGTGADSARTAVNFGGTGALASSSATRRIEVRNSLSWYSANSHHLWRFTSQISRDALNVAEAGNTLGRLLFSSLDDLRSGRPTSYYRDLGQRAYRSDAWNVGLSLGDQWRPTDALFVQYGVRADGDALTGSTGTLTAAGERAQANVKSWALSPRVGVSLNHGTISQAGFGPRPRGTLRVGIGAFRGAYAPSDLRSPLEYSGMAGGVRQLECTGSSTPAADWRAWSQGVDLPAACVTSSSDATIRQNANGARADVVTLARNYRPPTSWRANFGWIGEIGLGLQLLTDVTMSKTWGLTGTRFINAFSTPAFRLGNEDGRPVYVGIAQIDERLGIAPAPASVRTATMHSDLRSRAVQLSASLAPANVSPADRVIWGLSYAWTNTTNESSGFDGTTAGNPNAVEWAPSVYAARHRVTGFAAMRFANGAFLSMGAQWQSGLPFTPLVGGDVNGDGFINDRAFVSGVASGVACLRQQDAKVAIAGSCHGPSQTSLSASLIVPGALLRLPSRSTITIGFINPLAGIDQLLHGRNARGWGQSGTPDPVLTYPIGFDAARREYRYAANPTFGDIRRDALSRWQASRVTIDVRVPVSRPQHEQLLHQVMAPGRERPGNRLTAEQVKQRYMSFGVINPVQSLYRVRDSLHLTDAQSMSLNRAVHAFDARLDSIWGPLAHELAAADRGYDRASTLTTIRDAQRLAWDALEDAVTAVRAMLTVSQMDLIDPAISALLDPRAIARLRRTEFRF